MQVDAKAHVGYPMARDDGVAPDGTNHLAAPDRDKQSPIGIAIGTPPIATGTTDVVASPGNVGNQLALGEGGSGPHVADAGQVGPHRPSQHKAPRANSLNAAQRTAMNSGVQSVDQSVAAGLRQWQFATFGQPIVTRARNYTRSSVL
jgi:hypothetical protein